MRAPLYMYTWDVLTVCPFSVDLCIAQKSQHEHADHDHSFKEIHTADASKASTRYKISSLVLP